MRGIGERRGRGKEKEEEGEREGGRERKGAPGCAPPTSKSWLRH